jgi:hypothetical protein
MVLNLEGGRMSSQDDSSGKSKHNEALPGVAVGQGFEARNITGASDRSDDSEYRLISWQKQVVADDDLDRTAKFILLAWGLESVVDPKLSDERGELVRVIEPVPAAMLELTGIPESTYYRYVKQVQESGWLENVGAFRYDTGGRQLTGVRYALTDKKGRSDSQN